jgi:hypothetical protein
MLGTVPKAASVIEPFWGLYCYRLPDPFPDWEIKTKYVSFATTTTNSLIPNGYWRLFPHSKAAGARN